METEIESNNKKMKRSNWNLMTSVKSKKDALSNIRESVECQNMGRYDKISDNQYTAGIYGTILSNEPGIPQSLKNSNES